MRIRALLALACSVLLFGLVTYGIVLPATFFGSWRLKLAGADESRIRREASERNGRWGGRLFRWICRLMAIRVSMDLPDGDPGDPAIIMMNHRGTFDILAALGLASATRRLDLRWVLKREMMQVFGIAYLAWRTGCIPVSRNRDPLDMERLIQGARRAGREGANLLLFPEGTRFEAHKASEGYLQVLKPKHGGFDILIEELPDYPVLDATISWHPPLPARSGKTLFDSASLYGREFRIRARRVSAADAHVPGWLDRAWRMKDEHLSTLH